MRTAALRLLQGSLLILTISLLQSCSSAKKQRMEERERVSAATGFYCQFINGDQYSDFEVVLNLEMAKRCDSNKPFSISDYKSSADIHGLLYCCSMRDKKPAARSSEASEVSNFKAERQERAKPAGIVAKPTPKVAPAKAMPPGSESDDLDAPAPASTPAKAAAAPVEKPVPQPEVDAPAMEPMPKANGGEGGEIN